MHAIGALRDEVALRPVVGYGNTGLTHHDLAAVENERIFCGYTIIRVQRNHAALTFLLSDVVPHALKGLAELVFLFCGPIFEGLQ